MLENAVPQQQPQQRPNTTMSSRTSQRSTDIFANTNKNTNNSRNSHRNHDVKLTTVQEIPQVEMTDHYFMPKKQILRSDGATLLDIYQSKQDDTWGKIIKAQYLEDVGFLFSI